jgi:formamidopyrimidine-DNA glycosylase
VPELIEVEQYRGLAVGVVGRRVRQVAAPDPWFLKGGVSPAQIGRALRGCTILGARRHGKLLVLDTDGPRLGLRFGMTGRLLVDGLAAITELEYGSAREEPAWDRFRLRFEGGGDLTIRDPRRLGGVELDPDESSLGPDAATVGVAALRRVLASDAPLKARLLDQTRIAGLGNLLCDEALWRAGLDPFRPARTLSEVESRGLQRAIRRTVADLSARGGSHTGDLQPARVRGGRCPRDGAELERRTIGGRTTYSCPAHQR